MAAIAEKLTPAEFEQQYGDRKPYHEYWFGEAVPKSMPNVIHAALRVLISALLRQFGFKVFSELKLKISDDFQPLPDIVGIEGPVESPYPTTPPAIVAEILSPDDSFMRVTRKSRIYAEWGIQTVAVIDPEERRIWVWDGALQSMRSVTAIELPNGKSLSAERIFGELDEILK